MVTPCYRYPQQTYTVTRSKHIRNVHQTSTLSSCNIAYMYIVDIGFSHGAEPILIMRVAYTHIVSIGSAACQEPLETMSGATHDKILIMFKS